MAVGRRNDLTSNGFTSRFVGRMSRLKEFTLKAMVAVTLGLVALTGLWTGDASAEDTAGPPQEPILRIDPGRHTAMIRRIDIDADERFIVSSGDDKTARLWSARDGRLLSVFRPPIGPGNEGKLFAVAISPDARWVATGGWTSYYWEQANSIYIFDRASGLMQHRISGIVGVINDLEFSPDGRYLAAALGGNGGARVWQVPSWREELNDSAFQGMSLNLAWSRDNRLAVPAYDGDIRLYQESWTGFTLERRSPAPARDKRPYDLSFTPDGSGLALGYLDEKRVDLVAVPNLRHQFTYDTRGGDTANVGTVRWSRSGDYLYGAGQWWQVDSRPIRRWPVYGSPYFDLTGSPDTIMDLKPFGRDGIVFGAAAGDLGAYDANGRKRLTIQPVTPDFREQHEVFRVSQDGKQINVALKVWGNNIQRFDLAERTLTPVSRPDPALQIARTVAPGLNPAGYKHTRTPTLNGRPLSLDQFEVARSLAISPDGNRIAMGADWSVRLYDRAGRQLWKTESPGTTWNVAISGDGRVLVAAYSDGTVRWHRLSDGETLLSLFLHGDGERWVAWTPSGYYIASPGGENLMGWHVNRGPDEAADFFGVGQFRERFYRPDVIERVLDTLDEDQAIRLADQARGGRRSYSQDLRAVLPPVVAITAPADGDSFSERQVTVSYTLRSPSGQQIERVKVLVNGRQLTETGRGLQRVGTSSSEQTLTVTLPTEDVELALLAETADAASEPATIRLRYVGQTEFHAKPKLYALVVGVSDYARSDLKLAYAAKDASDFAAMLESQRGTLYDDVDIQLLTDRGATQREILKGLQWLRRETTNRDVGMLFLAGHGVTDADGEYYYLPQDADPDFLLATAITNDHIRQILSTLPGKAVFFTDTCHAGDVIGGRRRGAVDINRVANALASAENGVVVFTSSTGRQISVEDGRWQNGAFTEALLEGLSGRADYTKDGAISVNELDLWLAEKVKALTEGQQSPTTTKPETVPDFPIFISQ